MFNLDLIERAVQAAWVADGVDARREFSRLREALESAPITMLHLASGYQPETMRAAGLPSDTRIALVVLDA